MEKYFKAYRLDQVERSYRDGELVQNYKNTVRMGHLMIIKRKSKTPNMAHLMTITREGIIT